MKKIEVQVAPAIISWVISQSASDKLSEKVAKNLQAWKDGKKVPTFNQIEAVSSATGIPLGYFFLDTPPVEDNFIIQCRTVDSVALTNPSRDLINTIHDMEMIQEWTRDHLISEEFEPLNFIGKSKLNVTKTVDEVRDIIKIAVDWQNDLNGIEAFNYIRNAISESGVIVMANGIVGANTHRALDVEEFRAFTIIDNYAPVIFINSNDSKGGKLFSLLHEFVHVCLGENDLFNDRYSIGKNVSQVETICNSVAAEIIVPQSLFLEKWRKTIRNNDKKQTISMLADDFKCGQTVIARKALDNKLISQALYEEIARLAVKIYNDQRARNKEKNGGGNYYNNLSSRIDKRFFRLLASSVAEGKTLYTEAYRLTHTNSKTFDQLVNQGGDK